VSEAERLDAARRGSNRGHRAMREAVAWLREHGAPHADIVTRNHASDITGVGDLAIECTVEPFTGLPRKMGQSAGDACRREVEFYGVLKKRVASPGEAAKTPADWWWVEPFGLRWELHQRMSRLEAENLLLRKIIREGNGAAS
jgi:hypothetical protein